MENTHEAEAAPQLFRLELLPSPALCALFRALRYDEVARACCVCAAWRAAFSLSSAAHLWADIVLDEAHFGGLEINEVVVRGAAAKAGAALRSLSLVPQHCVAMLPSLAAAHAGLRRVLVGGGDCLSEKDGAAWLAAAAAVPELHANVALWRSDIEIM